MPLACAIYCRLSDNPGGRSIGLGAQESDARKLVASLGGHVVQVVVDDDITAANPDLVRPGFERIIEGVLVGDWTCVVAYDQHRFLRLSHDLERVIRTFAGAGAQLHYVSGVSDLESPEGRLFARVTADVGTYESEKAKARTRRNMAERARLGLPLSGRAGFGYAKAAGDDNYVVVEHEAVEVKRAAERVLAGDSLAQIAEDWNTRVGGNRRAGRWSPSSVRRVLLAPRTAGLRQHHDVVVGKAAWPAILDEETFARVRQVLTDPRRRTANSRTAKLLTGTIQCGGCDRTMNHKVTYGAGKYYCRHCLSRTVHADALERFVVRLVFRYADSHELERLLTRAADDESGTLDVLSELDGVKLRRAQLAAAWAAGERSDEEWEAARAVLVARQRALRARLDEATSAPLLSPWAGRGDALAAAWESGAISPAEKRALVRSAFRWIRIGPAVQGLGRFDPDRVTWEYA